MKKFVRQTSALVSDATEEQRSKSRNASASMPHSRSRRE